LAEIWLSSNGTAAICHVLAKKIRIISPDEALTVGLFHQLGNLWLVTYAQRKGIDLQANPAWDQIAAEWQAIIGDQIVRKWGLPDHVAECIKQQDSLAELNADQGSPYVKLLSAAKLYNTLRDQQGSDQATAAAAILKETNLWGHAFLPLVAECHEDIESMRQAIS